MFYRVVADCLVLVHLAFVVFVVAGGLLVLWRPSLRWIHLPAAAWGALIEFTGWICPLTPWEQALRVKPDRLAIQADSSSTTFSQCSTRRDSRLPSRWC